MEPYRTILAGVHDTQRGQRAIDRAIQVASCSRATLYLATATAGDADGAGRVPAVDRGAGAAEAIDVRMEPDPDIPVLNRLLEQAREQGVPEAHSVSRPGRPVDVLVDTAADLDAGLVVVGSHGVNTTAGRVFGSIAATTARRAASDVLVVHTTDERWHMRRARRRRLGATTQPYRRVLVGVHESTRDAKSMTRVVETGAKMAAVCEAEVVLLASFRPARSSEILEAENALGFEAAYTVRGSNAVEATLDEASRTARAVGATAPRILAQPYAAPGRALVDGAASADADLVVVGSHGLRQAHPRLLGAVAASVLRRTPADVLIINTEELAAAS